MLMTTDMTESSVANVGPSPTPPPQVTGKIHTLSLRTESTPEAGCVVDQIAIISSRNGVLIFFFFYHNAVVSLSWVRDYARSLGEKTKNCPVFKALTVSWRRK